MDLTGVLLGNNRGIDSQSAANYFNTLASERAQAAQDESFRSRDLSTALQLAQMQDQRMARQAQVDEQAQRGIDDQAWRQADYFNRQGQESYNRGIQAKDFGLRKSEFDLRKAYQDKTISDELKQTSNTGQALAQSFAEVSKDFGDTENQFKSAQDKLARLHAMAVRAGGQKNRNGFYVPPTGVPDVDGSITARLQLANQAMPGLLTELDQLKQQLAVKGRDLRVLKDSIVKSGFIRNNGGVVDAFSGARFGAEPAPVVQQPSAQDWLSSVQQTNQVPISVQAPNAPTNFFGGTVQGPFGPMEFQMPVPQPQSLRPPMVPTPEARVKGKIYQLPDGSAKIWIGNGWIDPGFVLEGR